MISNSLCTQFKRITEITLVNWLKILATTIGITLITIFFIVIALYLTKISLMLPTAKMSSKELGILVTKFILGTITIIGQLITLLCISAAIFTVYGRTMSLIFFIGETSRTILNYTDYLFQLLTKHHMLDGWAIVYSFPLLPFIMILIIVTNILILTIAQGYTAAKK